MLAAASGSSAFRPGIYALIVLGLLLGLAVWMAKRDRDRRDKIRGMLGPDAWTAPCLDPAAPGTSRMLIVTDDGLAIAEARTGSRDSWPWAEVGAVMAKPLRSRLQSYPGIRISFVDGHVRELLVYLGTGKASYADGATAALANISRHLPREDPV